MHRETAMNAGDATNSFTGAIPVSSSHGSLLCQAALDCRALSSSIIKSARPLMMSVSIRTGSDDVLLHFSHRFLLCLIMIPTDVKLVTERFCLRYRSKKPTGEHNLLTSSIGWQPALGTQLLD